MNTSGLQQMQQPPCAQHTPRVLCILGSQFEEIETVAPIDLLRRAGAEVVVASVTGELLVTGRSNITVRADTLLDSVPDPLAFDLLLIPGGPGVKQLRAKPELIELVKRFAAAGKPVAAICAAPLILADAGLLAGRNHTAHFSVKDQLPLADLDRPVVEDGNIITSRGAGTSIQFGLALVRRLCGEPAAEQVARAIMI